jgi:hypothetical protein
MQCEARLVGKSGRHRMTWVNGIVVLVLGGVFNLGHVAQAIDWSSGAGADRSWLNTNNWSGHTLPTSSDNATIYWGQTAEVSAPGAVCSQLDMGAGYLGTKDGNLEISGGDLTVAGYMIVGEYNNGTGIVHQTGGTVNVGNLSLGEYEPLAYGYYELVDGVISSSGSTFVNNNSRLVQRGGTNYSAGYTCINNGTYDLTNGLLKTGAGGRVLVGNRATGVAVLNQSGGTIEVGSGIIEIGAGPQAGGGTGIYNFVSGSLVTTYLYVGGDGWWNNVGIMNMGNGSTSPVVQSATVHLGTGSGYTNSCYGAINGWGAFKSCGIYLHAGYVVADGYGTDRTLDCSTSSFDNNDGSLSSNSAFRAQNHGRLLARSFAVSDGTYYWPDMPSAGTNAFNPTNSIKMALTGGSGTLTGALLAADHSSVSNGLKRPIGVWDFSGATFSSCALTIRYDANMAAQMRHNEGDLRVRQYKDGAWRDITVSVDTANKLISATAINPLTQIAVDVPPRGSVLSIN